MLYKPLKKFGQNYLTDENILKKIYNEINPNPDDFILEIGPGYGALTKYFINHKKYLGIEIDTRTFDYLCENYSQLQFNNIDILDFDLSSVHYNNKIRIIGNIPYNITSPIIFKIVENYKIITDATLMVQLEVAKRLIATPGSKDYSLLTVITDFFMNKKLCFKVSKNCFNPKPNVDSAIIHLFIKENLNDKFDSKLFIQVVKACFNTRRKQLKNSLKNSIFSNVDFTNSPIPLTLRAEELSLSDFIKFTEFISNQIGDNQNG